jgi:hypothetical protein
MRTRQGTAQYKNFNTPVQKHNKNIVTRQSTQQHKPTLPELDETTVNRK